MSYPINQPITYTAVASTQGASDTFTYAWTFDDGGIGNTASLSHTWTTGGLHTATVTATDTTTLGVATATKSINFTNFSSLTWVSTGSKIIPAATNIAQDPIMPLMISGNLLVNIRDYYNPGSAVSFDTVNMVRAENTSATSTLTGGGPATGIILTAGANSGKILVISKGGTDYGFLDPATLTMVKSSNTMPAAFSSNPTVQHICISINSTQILILGNNVSDGPLNCFLYNQLSDSWQTLSTSGGPFGSTLLDAALVGGKVWVINDNSLNTTQYNISTNTWSAGPTLNGIAGYSRGPTLKLAKRSDGFPFLVSYANPGTAYWWDGVSPTLIAGSNFPLASINGGSLSSISTSICTSSPDGFILMAGGEGSGNTVALSNSVIYSSNSNSFIILMGAFGGFILRFEFLNGRFWACDQNGGVLYYTNPMW